METEIIKTMDIIQVEVLKGAKAPYKKHKTDAGFDLFATEDIEIYFGQVIKHPVNVKLHLPEGSWAEIKTKSGLGSRGLLVYAGVIDEGYRGIIHVVMSNIKQGDDPIVIKAGEKLAQMTMHPHHNGYKIEVVDKVSEDTERAAGGFGSTGK